MRRIKDPFTYLFLLLAFITWGTFPFIFLACIAASVIGAAAMYAVEWIEWKYLGGE